MAVVFSFGKEHEQDLEFHLVAFYLDQLVVLDRPSRILFRRMPDKAVATWVAQRGAHGRFVRNADLQHREIAGWRIPSIRESGAVASGKRDKKHQGCKKTASMGAWE